MFLISLFTFSLKKLIFGINKLLLTLILTPQGIIFLAALTYVYWENRLFRTFFFTTIFAIPTTLLCNRFLDTSTPSVGQIASKVKVESERKLSEAKDKAKNKLAEAKAEAKKKVSEAQKKLAKAKAESKKKLTEAKVRAEKKLAKAKKVAKNKLAEAKAQIESSLAMREVAKALGKMSEVMDKMGEAMKEKKKKPSLLKRVCDNRIVRFFAKKAMDYIILPALIYWLYKWYFPSKVSLRGGLSGHGGKASFGKKKGNFVAPLQKDFKNSQTDPDEDSSKKVNPNGTFETPLILDIENDSRICDASHLHLLACCWNVPREDRARFVVAYQRLQKGIWDGKNTQKELDIFVKKRGYALLPGEKLIGDWAGDIRTIKSHLREDRIRKRQQAKKRVRDTELINRISQKAQNSVEDSRIAAHERKKQAGNAIKKLDSKLRKAKKADQKKAESAKKRKKESSKKQADAKKRREDAEKARQQARKKQLDNVRQKSLAARRRKNTSFEDGENGSSTKKDRSSFNSQGGHGGLSSSGDDSEPCLQKSRSGGNDSFDLYEDGAFGGYFGAKAKVEEMEELTEEAAREAAKQSKEYVDAAKKAKQLEQDLLDLVDKSPEAQRKMRRFLKGYKGSEKELSSEFLKFVKKELGIELEVAKKAKPHFTEFLAAKKPTANVPKPTVVPKPIVKKPSFDLGVPKEGTLEGAIFSMNNPFDASFGSKKPTVVPKPIVKKPSFDLGVPKEGTLEGEIFSMNNPFDASFGSKNPPLLQTFQNRVLDLKNLLYSLSLSPLQTFQKHRVVAL